MSVALRLARLALTTVIGALGIAVTLVTFIAVPTLYAAQQGVLALIVAWLWFMVALAWLDYIRR